jgi:hypothetical protein
MSKPLLDVSKRKNSFASDCSDDQIVAKSLQLKPARRESRSPSLTASPKQSFGSYRGTNPLAKASMGSQGSMGIYRSL